MDRGSSDANDMHTSHSFVQHPRAKIPDTFVNLEGPVVEGTLTDMSRHNGLNEDMRFHFSHLLFRPGLTTNSRAYCVQAT